MIRKILITVCVALVGLVGLIFQKIHSEYEFEKKYKNYWSLSDKSSTIKSKKEYIDKFVNSLEDGFAKGKFGEHNAIFLKTPDNGFKENLEALKSLRDRLQEIEGMDPKTFEYNTAIQQITGQEQGESEGMISVIYGCFLIENYFLIWGWVGNLLGSILMAIFIIGLFIIGVELDVL